MQIQIGGLDKHSGLTWQLADPHNLKTKWSNEREERKKEKRYFCTDSFQLTLLANAQCLSISIDKILVTDSRFLFLNDRQGWRDLETKLWTRSQVLQVVLSWGNLYWSSKLIWLILSYDQFANRNQHPLEQ